MILINRSLYFQKFSIVNARWPKVGDIDYVLIKSSEYLMEVAHSFRLYLKQHLQEPKQSKSNVNRAPIEKPNLVTLWVAKTFPQWQSCILATLKTLYDVSIYVKNTKL